MLFFSRKPRPKRTPPASPYGPVDLKDAALEADQNDDQAFFFRCCKIFAGKSILIETNIGNFRSPESIGFSRSINILFRLYYEFQWLSYTNKDAGDAAIRTFLKYY